MTKKRLLTPIIAMAMLLTDNCMAQEMTYSPSATRFALTNICADEARVNIYNSAKGGNVWISSALTRDIHTNTWTATVAQDLKGMFYTFQIKVNGSWHDECPGINARAVGVNGKRGVIIDMHDTDPAGWEDDRSPAFHNSQNAIIYEMHHRDFSIHATSGIRNAGKFLALTEQGTKNADGLSTGIDHLKELGVTHVHLLPSYDFGSIDEKTGMALSGGGRIPSTYNWGYDPVNYNVPEGSYATDATNPYSRIREFKEMVMALHRAGIRVVMDVVYNHVFDHDQSSFNKLYPGEFFRYKEATLQADSTSVAEGKNSVPANGSGCGNETASDRPLMRQFMIESIRYWMQEYHIDGFRFDLMGIHDIVTMNLIREAAQQIDPNVIIYGEGWAAETPAYPAEKLAMKANTALLGGIAAFGDEMRDGLRGGWQNDAEGAFLIGKTGNEESVRFGIVGAVHHDGIDMTAVNYSQKPWAAEPSQMISYVSCHDDMCIADRLRCTLSAKYGNKMPSPDAFNAELSRLQKLAYTAVLTSRGIPFIWCGDEIMRNRKGVHNCYTSPDSINAIPWNLKTENKDVFDYIRGMIQLRKELRFQDYDISFLPVRGNNTIATHYVPTPALTEMGRKDVIVILNSNRKTVTVSLPQGEWTILTHDGKIEEVKCTIKGKAKVAPQSALILKRLQ